MAEQAVNIKVCSSLKQYSSLTGMKPEILPLLMQFFVSGKALATTEHDV